ncbi:MAG: AAA family ATPase [Spirochaeta sp.]|nr:AAA family ATPase [Spirochaeta sp.]
MRILELRFKNLNSLVGEWEIDLRHPAYSSDGIFAITGPTGSGKTTILDAVCLALYGRTPRLHKVTKSGNEIMSRHTGECFAEVVFETQAGRYRCHWSQHRSRRKPDGELQPPKHEIAHADSGEVLESKLKGVADQIEAATGMDFERFTRSMLLAQGGFAVFLQAAADERAPLLEQITGTEIYSRISIRVHERRKEEQDTLKSLQAETAGIVMLDPEQEQDLQRKLGAKEADERNLAKALTETEKTIGRLRSIDALQNEIAGLVKEEQQLQVEIDAFRPHRERLSRAEVAMSLDGEYATLKATRRQQAEDTSTVQSEEAGLPELESKADLQAATLEAAEERTARAKAEHHAATPKLRTLRMLDQKLEDLALAIREFEESCAKVAATIEAQKLDREQEQEKRATAVQELEAVQGYLDAHAQDAWLVEGLTGVEEQLAGLLARQEELAQKEGAEVQAQDALERAQQARDACVQQADLRAGELQAATIRLQQEKDALNRLLGGRLLREYRAERDTLLREQAFHTRIAELEEHRAKLEDGKPCPLCGATEHPFAQGNVPGPDATEQRIDELGELIHSAEELEAAVSEAAAEETAARSSLSNAEKAATEGHHETKLAEHRMAELRRATEGLRAELSSRKEAALVKLAWLDMSEVPDDDIDALLELLRERLNLWQKRCADKSRIEKEIGRIESQILRIDTVIEGHAAALTEKERQMKALETQLSAGRDERMKVYGDLSPDDEELRLNTAVADAERAERQAREQHQALQEKKHAAATRLETLRKGIAERAQALDTYESEFAAALERASFENEDTYIAAALASEERNRLKAEAGPTGSCKS